MKGLEDEKAGFGKNREEDFPEVPGIVVHNGICKTVCEKIRG